MSDLSKPREAADWIEDWRRHYSCAYRGSDGPARFRRLMARTYAEQRANADGMRHRDPEYEESIALIEAAARLGLEDEGLCK